MNESNGANSPALRSPERVMQDQLDARVLHAMRARVWTAVYAAVVGSADIVHEGSAEVGDNAARAAAGAVRRFNEWSAKQ